jgi:hypothetical protein
MSHVMGAMVLQSFPFGQQSTVLLSGVVTMHLALDGHVKGVPEHAMRPDGPEGVAEGESEDEVEDVAVVVPSSRAKR